MRNLQLGFSLGVAAFLLGILISSRLSAVLYGTLASVDSGIVRYAASLLMSELPALVIAPVIAYVAGLYFEGPRWVLAWSMVVGAQLFPVAVELITGTADYLVAPAQLVPLIGSTIVAGLLCGWALGRGQKRARREPAEAKGSEPVAAEGPLSKIDFAAVKKAVDAESTGEAMAVASAAAEPGTEAESKPQPEPAPAAEADKAEVDPAKTGP
ncbi:MAG: hypothetical protein ACOX6T_00335 [Myxococcales bacterium]